jgi:hypothetical protein
MKKYIIAICLLVSCNNSYNEKVQIAKRQEELNKKMSEMVDSLKYGSVKDESAFNKRFDILRKEFDSISAKIKN